MQGNLLQEAFITGRAETEALELGREVGRRPVSAAGPGGAAFQTIAAQDDHVSPNAFGGDLVGQTAQIECRESRRDRAKDCSHQNSQWT